MLFVFKRVLFQDGELSLVSVLQKRGLDKCMFRQASVVLNSTVPDFCWFQLKKAVYLDGVAVHRKAHVKVRDEEINKLMAQKGWQVLRIPYDPPLTPSEVAQIVQKIKDFIRHKTIKLNVAWFVYVYLALSMPKMLPSIQNRK